MRLFFWNDEADFLKVMWTLYKIMKLNKSKENKINNDKKGKSKSECFTVQTKTVDQSQFSVWFAIFYSAIELLPYKSTELVRDFTWRLFIEQILSCFLILSSKLVSFTYLNCVFWHFSGSKCRYFSSINSVWIEKLKILNQLVFGYIIERTKETNQT